MAPRPVVQDGDLKKRPIALPRLALVTDERRSQAQGQCMCPWELICVCLSFKVFLYKDGLGFVLPRGQYPLKFCWNQA